MKINGNSLGEHIRLLAPLLGLIGTVWILRMVLSAAGAPAGLTILATVQAVVSFALLLAVALMHVRRFGGYANVIVCSFFINSWAQLLIIAAILFAVLTGTENVYTAHEFSFGGHDPHHLRHMLGHTISAVFATLFGSVVGSLLLWVLRWVLPPAGSNARPT